LLRHLALMTTIWIFNMFEYILILLIVATLLFTVVEVSKIKKENKILKNEIEDLKKNINK
ncbi:hypothetical protein, partial [Bacillus safensis]|uniref:hypothetical protein n=1 Tax=Bacillus safensis TaxID=561879 RepID=UPI00300006A0